MKEIKLTRGCVALVDDEDYAELSRHKWYVNVSRRSKYAHRQFRDHGDGTKYGKRVLVLMHRQVMRAPKGKNVDHINGDGLDNRKENLRLCTQSQNLQNQNRYRPGWKGVYPKGRRWGMQIAANGESHSLNGFCDSRSAAKAYDKLAKILHGEFACLNFPDEEIVASDTIK